MTVENKRIRHLGQAELKDFPALAKKILPVSLLLAGVAGCQNASVSANAGSPKAPVVAPAGSVLRVRLDQSLDTRRSRPGDRFSGVLDSPIAVDGRVVLPKGTIVQGHVLSVLSSGRLNQRARLVLTLDSCRFENRTLSLDTATVVRVAGSHRKRSWTLVGEGAAAGPIGAASDSAGAAVSDQKDVSMPAESVVGFTLKTPLVV